MSDFTRPKDSGQAKPDEQYERECHERHLRQSEHFASTYNELVSLLQRADREFDSFYEYAVGAGMGDLAKLLHDAVRDTVDDKIWLGWLGECFSGLEHEVSLQPEGFVYILRSGDYFKIGRSKSLGSRIKTLKIQLPFAVEVHNAFPCEDSTLTERYLHGFYQKWRTNGEWFRFTKPHIVRQLRDWKYATNTPPDDEYFDVCGPVDLHEDVPVALRAVDVWAEAFREAESARDGVS